MDTFTIMPTPMNSQTKDSDERYIYSSKKQSVILEIDTLSEKIYFTCSYHNRSWAESSFSNFTVPTISYSVLTTFSEL